MLSREAPCIDNLEPFIRSLPCRDRHGLAAFLRQPSLLLEGDHLGLSLHIRRYCRCGEQHVFHLPVTSSYHPPHLQLYVKLRFWLTLLAIPSS